MRTVKLTKKCFMSLPPKVLLVSNICKSYAEPCFLEEIAPFDEREEQWQRIVAVGAEQRLFRICNNMDEWKYFLSEVINRPKYLDASSEK